MKVLLICNYKPGVGGISGQVELLQKHLREEGHTADIFTTKTSFLRRLMLPLKLQHRAKQYDVLHIHCCSGWGFLPAVVGIATGRRLSKRTVTTYHGGGGEAFFDKHSKLVRHFLSRTNANIVLSGFLANIFDKHHLPYTIIPNIIDLDDSQFHLRETLKPNFICIRAHEPLYNIPCIFRAFKRVQEKIPYATLSLVGDGSLHDTLVSQASMMELNNVKFTGRVDNSEIYNHLNEADIMLSSPTVDNMPVSILEAMNAGLLVISSNVGGVPFMIENGQTGLLFPSNDDGALATCMLQALERQKDSLCMIETAHNEVKKYSWAKVREPLLSLYQE